MATHSNNSGNPFRFRNDRQDWRRPLKHFQAQLWRKLWHPLPLGSGNPKQAVDRRTNGPVLYVLNAASLLDYALFSSYLAEQDLPVPRYLDGLPKSLPVAAFKSLLHRDSNSAIGLLDYLKSWDSQNNVDETETALFALQTRKTIYSPAPAMAYRLLDNELRASIDLATQRQLNLQFIPVFVLWSREPDHMLPSFGDRLFGTQQVPGYLRKACQVLLNRKIASIHLADPIALSDVIEMSPEKLRPDLASRRVKKALSRSFTQQRRIATGPMRAWKGKMIEKVLRDPQLSKTMNRMARHEALPSEEIQNQARGMLEELAADYRVPHTGFLHFGFLGILKRCFGKLHIDELGFRHVRECARKQAPLILLPSHKSHVDYLLMSDIFYTRGLTPPHIAAGINLSFWPMGYFFRKAGAYFIRRQIKGDLLYARTLQAYIKNLIKDGYHQEIFIEGGRSRDGKLANAKYGLLTMVIDAFLDQLSDDLCLLPISISYDKIPEDENYARELRGKPKRRETLVTLIKGLRHLMRKHGDIYVNFGKSISVRERFEAAKATNESFDKRLFIQDLSNEVMQSINRVTPLTPTGTLAIALLAETENAIGADVLIERCQSVIELFQHKELRIARTSRKAEEVAHQGLDLFNKFDLLEAMETARETLYKVKPRKRPMLNYYRNSSLHHFLPECLFAAALLSASNRQPKLPEIKQTLAFLMELLQPEFIQLQDPNNTPEHFLIEGSDWFIKKGYVKHRGDDFDLHLGKPEAVLSMFASQLGGFLEAAVTVTSTLIETEELPKEPEQLVELLSRKAKELHWRGVLHRSESRSLISLRAALQTIQTMEERHGLDLPHMREQLLHLIQSPLANEEKTPELRTTGRHIAKDANQ